MKTTEKLDYCLHVVNIIATMSNGMCVYLMYFTNSLFLDGNIMVLYNFFFFRMKSVFVCGKLGDKIGQRAFIKFLR